MTEQQETMVSQEKFDEMVKELETLKTVRRTEIAKNLEYARSLGDLSENAEYQEALMLCNFLNQIRLLSCRCLEGEHISLLLIHERCS